MMKVIPETFGHVHSLFLKRFRLRLTADEGYYHLVSEEGYKVIPETLDRECT